MLDYIGQEFNLWKLDKGFLNWKTWNTVDVFNVGFTTFYNDGKVKFTKVKFNYNFTGVGNIQFEFYKSGNRVLSGNYNGVVGAIYVLEVDYFEWDYFTTGAAPVGSGTLQCFGIAEV